LGRTRLGHPDEQRQRVLNPIRRLGRHQRITKASRDQRLREAESVLSFDALHPEIVDEGDGPDHARQARKRVGMATQPLQRELYVEPIVRGQSPGNPLDQLDEVFGRRSRRNADEPREGRSGGGHANGAVGPRFGVVGGGGVERNEIGASWIDELHSLSH
jgi:hypothetical protein